MWPFKKKTLSDYEKHLPRESLIQGSRITVIDDEDPLLIEELKNVGFAVDHDRDGSSLRPYDAQLYDVAIVDFHGVGASSGSQQGLSLVKHIRRVSPRTRVIAYTSRSLAATESEFFTLSHAVLPKDWGLAESLVLIEEELRKSLSKQHLFDALLQKLEVVSPEKRIAIESAMVTALSGKDEKSFKKYLSRSIGFAAEKTVDVILSKMFA